MADNRLVSDVGKRIGADDRAAERTLAAVAAGIASRLTYGEAHTLLEYLPGSVRAGVIRALRPMRMSRFAPVEDLYEEVRLELRLPPGEAPHRVAAVAAALADHLPADYRRLFLSQLPRPLRELFVPPPATTPA